MKILTLLILGLFSATAFADPATTVKLRRLELLTIQVAVPGQTKTVPFSYADVIRQMMLTTSPRGTTSDDLVKTVEAWEPMKKAIDGGAKELFLDQPTYDILVKKMDDMSWSPLPDFAEAAADFISYVRGLQPQDYDATPKIPSP